MLEKGSLDSMEGIEDVGRPLLVVVGQIEIENRGRWRTAAIDLTVAPGYWKKRKKKDPKDFITPVGPVPAM
jgi:hypothetical protein